MLSKLENGKGVNLEHALRVGLGLTMLVVPKTHASLLEQAAAQEAKAGTKSAACAISYALGRLRTLFDDPLFVRTPEGMLPTPTAQQLAQPVGRAISSIREALRHTEHFDPGTSERVFRLSMTDIGEQVFLPPLCEKLQRVAPQTQLEARQLLVAQVEEALRLGQLFRHRHSARSQAGNTICAAVS